MRFALKHPPTYWWWQTWWTQKQENIWETTSANSKPNTIVFNLSLSLSLGIKKLLLNKVGKPTNPEIWRLNNSLTLASADLNTAQSQAPTHWLWSCFCVGAVKKKGEGGEKALEKQGRAGEATLTSQVRKQSEGEGAGSRFLLKEISKQWRRCQRETLALPTSIMALKPLIREKGWSASGWKTAVCTQAHCLRLSNSHFPGV